jgi:electron transport complex protein RnfC
MLKFTPERHLTGGIRLPPNKQDSTSQPIKRGLLPPQLVISTRQHYGRAADPVVTVGQSVLRGQTIAKAANEDGADVHAPTSGHVVAIERREIPLFSRVSTEVSIVIDTDGRNESVDAGIEPDLEDRDSLIHRIARGGIVGLGGAVYPTAAKLASGPEFKLLVINGAECEPHISCDDMLMRESAAGIVDGAGILCRLVGAGECVIAIERDKPLAIEAIEAAAEASGADNIRVAELPSIYPAGGERQLIDVLSGIEVSSKRYPSQIGYLCQNVGTAYAVHRLVRHGEPLCSRIVTVTGSGVAEPRNLEVMIGTPIADLIAACGGYGDDPLRLIHGGSMMGYSLTSDALPVTKATNCIIAAGSEEIGRSTSEWPCIRCGECAMACPAKLQPQDLLIAARRADAAGLELLALDECIECGCCDIVCPSHIPLTEIFRLGKPLLSGHLQQQAASELAEERHRRREERLRQESSLEHEQQENLKNLLGDEAKRAAAIRDAVARVRSRKHGQDPDGH